VEGLKVPRVNSRRISIHLYVDQEDATCFLRDGRFAGTKAVARS
jgi:hypothetical protein